MEVHPLYGPSLPEKGWVPAPRFMLRRQRVLSMLADLCPGKLLEVGCGPATLIYELCQRGFECSALETSLAALDIARNINPAVEFHQLPQPDWREKFDYLMAFEVLEHIEDDQAALLDWYTWLKPGGVLLVSVPAHMRKWTATDDWAGHCRRYERDELKRLLVQTGFTVERFESYGFPLANLIEPVRARVHARQLAQRRTENHNREHNNAMSGIDRQAESRLYPVLKTLPGIVLMRMAFAMQALFSRWDIGNGYVLVAVKRSPRSDDSDITTSA